MQDGCLSGSNRAKEEVMCNTNISLSKHLCLPRNYNKFDLPFPSEVNIIDIGIDIVDVLRINDKVNVFAEFGLTVTLLHTRSTVSSSPATST